MTRVFLAGLAYDYCVGYSALDARRLGFPAVVLRDACRAIDLNGSVAAMKRSLTEAGVAVVDRLNSVENHGRPSQIRAVAVVMRYTESTELGASLEDA